MRRDETSNTVGRHAKLNKRYHLTVLAPRTITISAGLRRRRRSSSPMAAGMDGLELLRIHLLGDQANPEVDALRRRLRVDPDVVEIEPEDETMDLNAAEVGDRPHLDLPCDSGIVAGQVIELYVAGLRELDHEGAVVVEGVRGDRVGQEAAG